MPEDVYDVLEDRGLQESDLPGYTGEITGADYAVGAGSVAGQIEELYGISMQTEAGPGGDRPPGILQQFKELGIIAVVLVVGLTVFVLVK